MASIAAETPAVRATRPSSPARRRQARKRYLSVLLFMSPWIVGFLAFTLYPMISSLYFSFTSYDLLKTPRWVGFANYRFMFTKDPLFWTAIKNTLFIILLGTSLRILVAIVTASLLVRPRRGMKVYRTIFFVPTMVPAVAAALAFLYLFNPATGPVNQILGALGMNDPPLWLYDPEWSKPTLVLLAIWGLGDTMIIFLAGMLDVPRQLYEAADLEGASGWQKFRFVTLPMISPVIFFSLVIGIIVGFQYFTQAYVISFWQTSDATSIGGEQNSLMFFATRLYISGFQNFKMGYASALAWVLLVITMICTLLVLRNSRRWVHYQGAVR
jgi:multiple sugar transport system permease protein